MFCPVRPTPRQLAQASQPNPDFAAAQTLLQQGKYDEAIAQLQAMAAKNPGLKGLSHELGTAYYKKGDYIKAIESFKQALAEDPQDKEASPVARALLLPFGTAQLKPSRCWKRSRAGIRGPMWMPTYILGLCYIQAKDYPQARTAFARMFAVPPDSAASYLFTARMLLRQEFDPIAEEYAQKAIALDPKLPLAHFFLGELHLYKSRIPEAISDFQQELALNPGHAPTYYKLADAYSRIQKFDDAERLLQRSIWLDSTSTGPYILMGKVLQKKGETELAVRALQHALGMDPNNSVAHHLLGQAYRDMGRNEDAERELKIAEQLQESGAGKPIARVGRTLLSDAFDSYDILITIYSNKTKINSKASDRGVRPTLFNAVLYYCWCFYCCSLARRSVMSFGSSCRNTRKAALVQPKPITFC